MVRGATGSVRIGPSLASRGLGLLAGEATTLVSSQIRQYRRGSQTSEARVCPLALRAYV